MKLLLLGGTIFVGRHLVEAAQARGHTVTLFNRGQHNAHLFPDAEKLRGDRDGDLAALAGRRWDAVIDTSGYVPRLVHDSASLLADAVEHYTFISTISVYADRAQRGIGETGALGVLDDPTTEEVTGESYGPLKALCEQAAEAAMPGRVLVVRPGLIVGPHDPTDRFTYWPARVARGGETLAPGEPSQRTQFIDVRDLAAWTIHMVEQRATGPYNATGPEFPLTMEALLATCKRVTGSDARFTWVPEEFLLARGVVPFVEMPLWVPAEAGGMLDVSVRKALGAGLRLRPLAETIRDTLAWHATRPADHEWRAGLAPEREAALLAAWHRQETT